MRVTESAASNAARSSTDAVNELVDEGGCANAKPEHDYADRIHPSHTIKQVGNDPLAIYCPRCACYSAIGTLRNLKEPCIGVVNPERRHAHRLLELGMIPGNGTTIPSHAKR